jgi:uncharacterized protein YqeY
MLEQQIEQDLKAALLGGDRLKVETLRGIKSALLYTKVEKGKRETGLTQEEEITVLSKEAKKRLESAELYVQGGNQDKAEDELKEKEIIDKYLPVQMDEKDLIALIDAVIKNQGAKNVSAMGKVIAEVKSKTAGAADGSLIAKLVKERLSA